MDRSNAAARLREFTAKSNDLHRRYLGDDAAFSAYQQFIDIQMGYFLPLYADLRGKPGFAAAIDFVVVDLTGPGIADRDRDLERVVPIMSRLLPERALVALANAMELNAAILEINLGIARGLKEQLEHRMPVSERAYCLASRDASSFAEFMRLVSMTRLAGDTLQHIAAMPVIRSLLPGMRLPARMSGFGELHAFLERGFDTFVGLEDAAVFLDVMEQRMTEVFHRVFETPVNELETAPIHAQKDN